MLDKQALAHLGKQASDMYLNDGVPLTDAVVKVASRHPSITQDHVQRVVENANLVTFEELFKNGPSKHVVFDLAEPEAVHDALNGYSEDIEPRHASYLTAPSYEGDEDEHTPKMASYQVPEHVQYRRDWHASRAAVGVLEKQAHTDSACAEFAITKFCQMCKQAAFEVGQLAPVLELAQHASTDKTVFEKVASAVSVYMDGRVPTGDIIGSAPNKEHPIYQEYLRVEDAIKTAAATRKGLINAEVIRQRVVSGGDHV